MTSVKYDEQLLEGSINPRPEWRNPVELDRLLVETLNFTRQDYLHLEDGMWVIYSREPVHESDIPLVVTAYQKRDLILHLFTNNPDRTSDMDMSSLLTDVKLTTSCIAESGLYKQKSTKERTAELRDHLIAMIAGGAAGFIAGACVIGALSKYLGVEIPLRLTAGTGVIGMVLFAGLYERSERMNRHAAKNVIDNMPSHPSTYLHGPPAVHLIESYVRPATRYRGATRVFDI